MEEKEKYAAEIETKLEKLNLTINEIKANQKQKKDYVSDAELDKIIEKHRKAGATLDSIKDKNKENKTQYRAEIDDLLNELDTAIDNVLEKNT